MKENVFFFFIFSALLFELSLLMAHYGLSESVSLTVFIFYEVRMFYGYFINRGN